jgi:hypothetical protein
MQPSWQDRLDCAATEAEVVVVAQDFMAQFSTEDIQQLPKICRPGPFLNANDVTAYSFVVVRHHLAGGSAAALRVHRLASFSSDASIRLSQLVGRSE